MADKKENEKSNETKNAPQALDLDDLEAVQGGSMKNASTKKTSSKSSSSKSRL